MTDRGSDEGPKLPGAKAPPRRRAKAPKPDGDESAGAPASVRMYVRIPRELHHRWEMWCKWHRCNPAHLIAGFMESKTRGMVVQQRQRGDVDEPSSPVIPLDERIAG